MRTSLQQRIQQIVVLLAALLMVLLLWTSATPEKLEPEADLSVADPTPAAQRPPATPGASATARPTPFSLPPPETQHIAVERRGQVSASVRRGALVMALELPSLRVEAGSVISAVVRFTNEHSDVSLSIYSRLRLRGEQGRPEDAWPSFVLGRSGYLPVAPSSTISIPLQLYVPEDYQALGLAPSVWAETVVQVSRGDDGAPGWWMELGPIFLDVVPASDGRGMSVSLEADDEGWRLRVLSATEQIEGPFWGAIRQWHADGSQTWQPLPETSGGEWAERWTALAVERIDALVTAPGAAATVISKALTITSTHQQEHYSFPGITEAEAFLGQPIPTLERLPAGAELERITLYQPQRPVHGIGPWLTMRYRLAAGVQLSVWRSLDGQAHMRPSLEQQRQLFPDLREVAIGGTTGLASRRLGEWRLEWELDGVRMMLSAPLSAVLADLVALAEQLR